MTPSELADREKGTESGHQRAIMAWAAMAQRHGFAAADDPLSYSKAGHAASLGGVPVPELEFLFHIPNGGDRDKRTAGNLKAEGVKPGVPDMCLPVGKRFYSIEDGDWGFNSLWIELKTPGREVEKNGGLSDVQIKWFEALTRMGHCLKVCYGWQQGVAAIKEYLG